ncbi:hypothetical protein [Ponticaulis sp.]|uniref:hypothetical protein n=1 Tax=Ponticaulis sp. TaxID=2020902 RepID=UPI000C5D478D|nr:hypothetical protein [Ponticaulis sp.]MAF58144.1 hypothetical protein [Ponticaulis sp.]MBN05226.1 hypothetical protein [Ponticaulis sp.]
MKVQFGFYPLSINLSEGPICISDLSDFETTVADFQSEIDEKFEGWVYAPLQLRRNFVSGEVIQLPYSARVFRLPKTHKIEHAKAEGIDHLEFHVWCLSFFLGMRLTTKEAGFVDATPYLPHKLNDFVLSNSTLAHAVQVSEEFWKKYKSDVRMPKRLAGAVHALFLSQYPQNLSYERFMYLYTAIDACFAMVLTLFPLSGRRPTHAARIEWMCQQFDIDVPSWASMDSGATEISMVRNDTFHEALFFDEPLGFSTYDNARSSARHVELEMEALVCRLIVAILGRPKSRYVHSPLNTRQRYRLEL